MSGLPDGWTSVPLRDLGVWVGGGTPSKSNPAFWSDGEIPWVSPKDMKVNVISDTEDHITKDAVLASATNVVPKGAVLVVTRSGILRHTLPVAVAGKRVSLNQDLKALTVYRGLASHYIAWALRCLAQTILNECAKGGTTVQSIETNQLLDFEIPIAPTAEQARIIAAIEEQFSRLDAGLATLERVHLNLERIKTAVLIHAFGQVANEGITSGDELFSFVTSGSRGWAKYYSSKGATFIRIGNVPRDGIDLDLTETQHVSPPATAEGRRTQVRTDDILISITADLGRVAVMPPTIGEAYVNQHLALVRPDAAALPRYLGWYLASPFGLRQWDKLRRGATKIGLGLDDIRAVQIPVPSVDVQQSTVAFIETAWDRLRCLEQSLTDCQQRGQSLRRSILAAAFSGKLVPQDPGDEPASVLLERICAERTSSNGHKRAKARGRRRRKITT